MIDQLFVTLLLATFATLSSGQISTAILSGNWNSNETWSDGRLPGTNATVIIPRNVTVSLNDVSTFNVNLLSIQVSGHLKIGSPSIESFRFESLANLMIFSGGILEDLTSSHLWSLSPNSIISIYPNAAFRSTQSTQIVSIVTRQNITLNANINGPFTLTIDLQGRMETYAAITFLPNQSGDFGANVTWLGGLAPTFNRCSPFEGGCVLIIPREYNVVRHNNQSTINGVDVHIYGSFKISSWGTYSFLYPMTFYIYNGGTFEETTMGGFRFFINTSIIIYPGGRFVGQLSNSHSSFRERNVILSTFRFGQSVINGPYRLAIDQDGRFIANGTLQTTTPASTEMLTCYSCSDCGDSRTFQTIQVPANQGYSCRKSSVFGVIDRDADRWCTEGAVNGNGLWCCRTNLCNSSSQLLPSMFLFGFFLFYLFTKK